MSKPLLVIVLGAPGAGKTTLAHHLATELDLPLLVRDDIKEILFDTLGWSDRPWSRKLGFASWRILHYVLEQFLRAGLSVIVESNFRNEYDRAEFAALQDAHHPDTVQILCEATAETLSERFKRRAESGERHPGHVDHVLIEDLDRICRQGEWQALEIQGSVLHIDMNDLEKVDYTEVAQAVRKQISEKDPACSEERRVANSSHLSNRRA